MQQGLLPENEKISSVDGNEWTPERRFSVVIETATLSEMELADYCLNRPGFPREYFICELRLPDHRF